MKFFYFLHLCLFVSVNGQISGFADNRPKLCPNASWNLSAITIADGTLLGGGPWGIFINTKNTIVAANRAAGSVFVWTGGSTVPTRNITGNIISPYSVFVNNNDDVYVDNGLSNYRVDKWSSNASNYTSAMYVCGSCISLFIDTNNNLHCSVNARHEVIVKSLNSRLNVWTLEAGTGTPGSSSTTLNAPRGIYVDAYLNLYVADQVNARVQKFAFGQLNGTTVAGTGPSGIVGIPLSGPTGIVSDADGYIFISDSFNNRIVGSGPYGFQCIVACNGAGSTASYLTLPAYLSFDSYGNIYVVDYGNNRLQKFILLNNSCDQTTTAAMNTVQPAITLMQYTTSSTVLSSANAISYNQPTFNAYAVWSGNGITFATSTIVGSNPYGLFVDINNTVYVADRADSRIVIWPAGSTVPSTNITTGLSSPFSVFATINGDIYIDNGASNYRVDKWTANGMNSTAMTVKSTCYDLFIDIANNLYCSMNSVNQVVTKTLGSNSNMWTIAAGTDCAGSSSNQLNGPWGIFVDQNLNLFVADCNNNRVQQFLSQQTSAITVAGSSASGTITLNCPRDVVLDGSGYLFIVDSSNNRIVGSSSNGFRCIVGCSTSSGSSSYQLNTPTTMSFDSYGNIYVVDYGNSRVQKFPFIPSTTYNLARSFNKPNFCPSTTWYINGVTFANSTFVGTQPYGVFVNTNNTVYVANRQYGQVLVWYQGNTMPNITLAGNMGGPLSLFVTTSGDMYLDNGNSYARVDKWSANTNSSVPVMSVSVACYAMFVDISNTLYCAMTFSHLVTKKWLADNGTTNTIVAGGGSGNASLSYPAGVYVDTIFNLYVGDCGNNRVQMFALGQMQATTVAGSGAPGTITLSCPNAVFLDANGYLFLTDNYNNRLIGSGPYGFRCLFGCDQVSDSASNHLGTPRTFSFDSYGNFFVADQLNNRIQMFLLASNSCNLSYNQPTLCAQSMWFTNASTVATTTQIGSSPYGLFIDGVNTIYMPSSTLNYTLVLVQGSSTMTYVYSQSIRPYNIFVTIDGSMYIDNGYVNGRVDRFVSNITTVVMNVNGSCYGLFVDLNNYLYCSMKSFHQVVKVLLNNGTTVPSIAAGTGSPGSTSMMLNSQQGIYVDNTMNLYVADCGNNRVQIFQSGQLNGVTVAGNGSLGTIALSCPTGIVLDSNGYLYIVDSNNHRIVGSSWNGYQCIVGCSGGGSTVYQLLFPQSMAFDSYGNIYVTDRNNSRIQKFSTQIYNCTVQPAVQSTTGYATSTIPNTSGYMTSAFQITTESETTNIQTSMTSTTTSTSSTSTSSTATSTSSTSSTSTSSTSTSSTATSTSSTSSTSTSSTSTSSTSTSTSSTSTSSTSTSTSSTSTSSTSTSTSSTSTSSTSTSTSPTSTSSTSTSSTSTSSTSTSTSSTSTSSTSTSTSSTSTSSTSTSTSSTSTSSTSTSSTSTSTSSTSTSSTSTSSTSTSTSSTSTSSTSTSTSSTSTSTSSTSTSSTSTSSTSTSSTSTSSTSSTSTSSTSTSTSSTSTSTTSTSSTSSTSTSSTSTSTSSTSTSTTSTSSTSTSTSSTLALTTQQDTNQTCYPPTVILIPGGSSLTSLLQYRRSQDFSISSMLELKCDTSLSTTIKWAIKNCTSTACENQIQLNQKVSTTYSELYIPAKTLPYGIYQLTINVAITIAPNLQASLSAYVQITATGITANLVQLGTSMITRGENQDLFFDPGSFSVDPDQDSFDATKWEYEYYCRIYGAYNFPNIQGILLALNDPRVDPNNPSCLTNETNLQKQIIYNNSTQSFKSSLTVLAGSLQANRIYQFMVILQNKKNSSIQATGYVLVTVQQTFPQLIAIGCVISTLCSPNLEFQLVNPTTQVALFSICIGQCSTLQNIQWNIYQGLETNSSSSTNTSIQWTFFSQMISYENIWFFGRYTTNFTALSQLFLDNSQINYWRFESLFTFTSENSSSALNFVINHPPLNGSCSITPLNGTITTIFTISCPNWFDDDGIQDYSLFTWTDDVNDPLMLAYSSVSTFQVRLPAGTNQSSSLNLIVKIRDYFNCISQVNLSSVLIIVDYDQLNNLITSSNTINTQNDVIRLFASGNQNVVGQLMTSVSQQFNQNNTQNIDNAISSGIPATTISVSSLTSQSSSQNSTSINESVLSKYEQDLNNQANIRDNLIEFLTNLQITNINSVKLQSTSLAQMTQSTNQLTRNAALLAAQKTYQLALSLYSWSTKVPYEDVQTASIFILQCATNTLTAINGPLQGRTPILNTDLARANVVPDDYDTDIESQWTQISQMSADQRNSYYQKQTANQIETYVNQINNLIISSLNIQLNLGQSLTINTSQSLASFQIVSSQSLTNRTISLIGNVQFQLPSHLTLNQTNTSSISIRSTVKPLASYENGSNTNLSRSISLSLLDKNGNDIGLTFDTNQSIHFFIPRDPNVIIPEMILQNVTSMNSTPYHLLFNFHYINITTTLPISVHIELQPSDLSLAYLFIYKFDQKPQLNTSLQLIDGWTIFCPSKFTSDNLYTYFLDNQQTQNHQSLIFALRELSSEEISKYCSPNTTSSLITNTIPVTDETFNFTSDYSLRVYTSGCYYFDDATNQWQSHGLIVGSQTNHYETECFAQHLTTFAGGFIVLPNPINWSYVFANMDFSKNKTIYLTLIITTTIYILLMIYARYQDKKDLEKLGVIPLADNQASDRYYYQILVFTGHRKNAGTKSKVYFVLSGDDAQTQVRTFSHPRRQIFQRSGIDAFVMSVPKSLGLLNYIRVWHDNSGLGQSASWFPKYIFVRDLQTMEKVYFIAQRWFAVEKDDGRIERTLPVAGELELSQFSYILAKKTYHNISESHLWFSIFSRPPSNRFTRTQRCTCCFVLLFISMLLNIMYYDLVAAAKTASGGLNLGPLIITREQIGIGVMVELLSLLPSLFIVQFFQRIRPRQQISPLQQTMNKLHSSTTMTQNLDNKKKKGSPKTFPWWCIFIAYFLSILIIGVSIFFIMVRGIEFGDLKTQQWLTSILSGFFCSICLTQPLKIVALAIIFALFCRNRNDDKDEKEYIDDIHFEFDQNDNNLDSSLVTTQISKRVNHLDENEVLIARKQRLKEIQMWSILREFAFCFVFLIIILIIVCSRREQNSFLEVQHFRNYFLNRRQADLDFTQISTIDDYWQWLENSFVGNLRAQDWYNGDHPKYLNGFLNDKTSRLIGWATMRQLRIKSQLCPDRRIVQVCDEDYSFSREEKQSFYPGWTLNDTTTTDDQYSSSILKAFQYQTSDQLDTYIYTGQHGIYSGNGYVYEYRGSLSQLKSNLSLLHQLAWIDEKTRAVFIQLTLYNPNVQLFTSVTMLVELLSTGSIHPSASFLPLNFYVFTSVLQLVCTIIYIFLIIYLMIKEIQKIFQLKLRYFQQFWSYIQIGIIVCSWSSLGIYVWHLKETNRISQLFEQTNGYTYVNLQLSAYVNDLLTFFQGFCCFFGMIKFIDVISFNPRLRLFTLTLSRATKELIGFAMMFSIVFMSFLCLYYLLFVSAINQCADLISTAQMLFEISLMKFDTSQLLAANAFLGPLCFALYIFIVVFVCLSMFFSIIADNFRYVNEKLSVEVDEGMLLFMWKRFLHWTRLRRPTANEIQEERDRAMRSKFFDPIANFPDRIDQLFEKLDRVHKDQQAELQRLDKHGV